MQKKWLFAIPLILILLVLCVAIAVVGLSSLPSLRVAGITLPGSRSLDFKAEETDERSFNVSGLASLTVDNFAGNVRVEKGSTDKIVVETVKEARGYSQQDAQNNLEKVTINMKQDGNALDIRVVLKQGEIQWSGKVDFVIRVPEKTQVKVDSDNGDLYLAGTDGAADLSTDFGSVEVMDIKGGALTVATSNGKVEANRVAAGSNDIELRSDFGDVTLSNAAGGMVTLDSNNGTLTLQEVHASGKVNLTSDFGRINFEDGRTGSLEVNTQNGEINLRDLAVSGTLQASSDFGSVRLTGCEAQGYDLETLNGAITVDGAAGNIKAHTDFGDVDIKSASDAVLDLASKNGGVTFEGSLGSGSHTLRSDFGNVLLRLPADQAFNIDLKTDAGKITSDFEVSMSGNIDTDHWMGKINGGGDLLTATTNNGNVTLEIAR